MRTITDLELLRLLQLVSPALPIGTYSYSQGLEGAIEAAWVGNESDLREWLHGQLHQCLARVDVPILRRLYEAFTHHNDRLAQHWSRALIAHRETSELRAEDRQGGQALATLLLGLGVDPIQAWQRGEDATLAAGFALAASRWNIGLQATALGYLWAWLENQILAAQKLMPLGQTAGQRLLQQFVPDLAATAQTALQLDDEEIGGSTLGLALASSHHETQYCRLFRS